MRKQLTVISLLAISLAATAQQAPSTGMPGHQMGDSRQRPGLKTPRVPFRYGLGMKRFRTLCASCHGKWADGTEQGPPLLHDFYKPSHHGDAAFYRAALQGVQAHHWTFGDMPRVEGATTKDVDKIVPFIRWLQKAHGIY